MSVNRTEPRPSVPPNGLSPVSVRSSSALSSWTEERISLSSLLIPASLAYSIPFWPPLSSVRQEEGKIQPGIFIIRSLAAVDYWCQVHHVNSSSIPHLGLSFGLFFNSIFFKFHSALLSHSLSSCAVYLSLGVGPVHKESGRGRCKR